MARGLVKHRVGAGQSTSLWNDYWFPNGPIAIQLGFTDVKILQLDPQIIVDSLISNHQWTIPSSLHHIPFFQSQDFNTQLLSLPFLTTNPDHMEWLPSSTRDYSHRLTMDYFAASSLVFAWDHLIWFKHHILKHGFIAWLALKERLATLDTKPIQKKHYTNACYLCLSAEESVDHLFFKCPTTTSFRISFSMLQVTTSILTIGEI
ncbi:uncharacterized protein LOC132281843 [Cornus florida]|uniref:uncharacterized protein LOC132281843 n=1 Tax=Cornus florida TaxID=4283 RepID=UPI0028A23C03|nr:uncharacterized protein LOC132281843 [Cornus florida]